MVLACVMFVAAGAFVYRSFYGMRIKSEGPAEPAEEESHPSVPSEVPRAHPKVA